MQALRGLGMEDNCPVVDKGIDSNGFVITNISIANVPQEFQCVLEESVKALQAILGLNLHSIYLYGSVGRGTAIFGKSDLDLSVIMNNDLSESEKVGLTGLEEDICNHHECISKLEFDIGTYHEAMVKNDFEWQFWLRHMCVCVWGEDLREQIQPFKPSLNVGLEMNKDIYRRLSNPRNKLSNTNFSAEGKSIAKKLLRTHYPLLSEKDSSFYESLSDIAACIENYEPSLKRQLEAAYEMAMGDVESIESVHELIEDYGDVVVEKFTRSGGITT